MGENSKKIGDKLEGFGTNLFKNFGWKEHARDREISCLKSLHSKKTHGLDLLFSFKDPHRNCEQGLIVECKNRQMKSITKGEIQKWMEELIKSIECSQISPELEDSHISGINLNSGLLLIHANDEFNFDKYQQYLSELSIPSKRVPINIFIAANDEINRWNSFIDISNKLKDEGHFKYLYPSIGGSSRCATDNITIHGLFSKYIFATGVRNESSPGIDFDSTNSIKRSILFSFAKNTTESFQYAWSLFKFYQLEDTDEYLFIFYPHSSEDASFIHDNFIRALKKLDNPIDSATENKIKIKIMDNRTLSPVDL